MPLDKFDDACEARMPSKLTQWLITNPYVSTLGALVVGVVVGAVVL